MKHGKKVRKKLNSSNRRKSKAVQTDLFPSDTQSDFPEFQDKTHPVPIGFGSVLHDLKCGKVKPLVAMLFLVANYFSSWCLNKTHCLSISDFSEYLGVNASYACKALHQGGRWLRKLKSGRGGSIFALTKHDREDVEELSNEPNYLWLPYGVGSPIDRLLKGDISWKSCLLWTMLRIHSDWSTAITHPTNMLELADLCNMGAQTICACIRELCEAGLLERLSGMNEPAVYQLLPKPKPKRGKTSGDNEYGEEWYGRRTKKHVISRNWQYRICLKNGKFEKRLGYNKWKRVSDHEMYNVIPRKIVEDLEFAYSAYCTVRNSFPDYQPA